MAHAGLPGMLTKKFRIPMSVKSTPMIRAGTNPFTEPPAIFPATRPRTPPTKVISSPGAWTRPSATVSPADQRLDRAQLVRPAGDEQFPAGAGVNGRSGVDPEQVAAGCGAVTLCQELAQAYNNLGNLLAGHTR